jgi:Rrf2 family nitric oxide-sensitive transcriptional repressor
MRLAVQTDYALRLLIYLAAHPERLSSVGEVAEAYAISKNHLVKVAHRLGQFGYIETIRGHAGGIRLGRPAHTINVGEVVRRFEPDFQIVECFDHRRNQCAITRECALKGPLYEAQAAFLTALDRYTIADGIAHPALRDHLVALRT